MWWWRHVGERAITVVTACQQVNLSAPQLRLAFRFCVAGLRFSRPVNAETPPLWVGFLVLQGSLTITYFHTGIRTIIGVESFHGPVRDGKGWDRLAVVIRHDLLPHCRLGQYSQSGRSSFW